VSFPTAKFANAGSYFGAYAAELARAATGMEPAAVERAAAILREAIRDRRMIFSCGNGGSCAISNHLLCDFEKGIQNGTSFRPKVVSLSANTEIITAIANDFRFEDVFVYQLQSLASAGDVLITISSSGNSENIVRAASWAHDNKVKVIALTGFDGGRSAKLADVQIHVPADNYGVIEDLHQSVMHILAQCLRMDGLSAGQVASLKF
jgi:D-sedoheptulose 7-phosphate isomerase